jgi:site-specific DNA-methyltransferase (adenine-specific)
MVKSWQNTLYYGDNLDILREHFADESVDLIYLDPPFNSTAAYNILFKEPAGTPSEAQVTAFDDTWHWTEPAEREYEEIVRNAPSAVVEMMQALRQFVGRNDMMAYLTRMCLRLLELQRVLKRTGTLYLHCDSKASHYLKILLDTVLGKRNFRNEIVWCYRGAGYPKRDFGRRHDIILRYSNSDDYVFNLDDVRQDYAPATKERFAHYIGNVRKGKDYGTQELHPLGRHPDDWWEIQPIAPSAGERLGYPTQKPRALLEKIILASSNRGDVVLDPFCGCGTAIECAQRLRRHWAGIDITHLAINVVEKRLKETVGLRPGKGYQIVGLPQDLAGARKLAGQNRFEFQYWALSFVEARPLDGKKKGPDKGIDGFIYFSDEKSKAKKAVVQVKSGKVSVKDIRDLSHVVERENAVFGVFLTLEKPSREMKTEAAGKGLYRSLMFGREFMRIQILTIEELFDGKRPDIPNVLSPYKQAQWTGLESELHMDVDQS